MDNFTFYFPTYFVFGKEAEKNTGKYVKRFGGTVLTIAAAGSEGRGY